MPRERHAPCPGPTTPHLPPLPAVQELVVLKNLTRLVRQAAHTSRLGGGLASLGRLGLQLRARRGGQPSDGMETAWHKQARGSRLQGCLRTSWGCMVAAHSCRPAWRPTGPWPLH